MVSTVSSVATIQSIAMCCASALHAQRRMIAMCSASDRRPSLEARRHVKRLGYLNNVTGGTQKCSRMSLSSPPGAMPTRRGWFPRELGPSACLSLSYSAYFAYIVQPMTAISANLQQSAQRLPSLASLFNRIASMDNVPTMLEPASCDCESVGSYLSSMHGIVIHVFH